MLCPCAVPVCYGGVQLKGEAKVFTPEEISAMILTRMKESAEQCM